MRNQVSTSGFVCAALLACATIVVNGQAPAGKTQSPGVLKPQPKPKSSAIAKGPVPKTSWGAPDLQGTWSNATMTPFERPDNVEAKHLTDEEREQRQAQLSKQREEWLSKNKPAAKADAFDTQVMEQVKTQAKKFGIAY